MNHLVESLPQSYRTILRDGLRTLQPTKAKAAFTAEEIRKVFNDTIGVIQDEASLQSTKTLGFQMTPNYKRHEAEDEEQQNDVLPSRHISSQQITYPHFNNYAQRQSSPQTASKAQEQHIPQLATDATDFRQVGNNVDRFPECSLCYNENDHPHPTHHCPHFPTPQEKREEFLSTNRCPNCTREEHPGFQCPGHLSCLFHPGERHYTWLCRNQTSTDDTA